MRRLPILLSSASDLHARCRIPAKVGNTRQNHQIAIFRENDVYLIIIFNTLVNHLSDFTVTLQHFTTRHIKIHHAFNSLRVSTSGNNYPEIFLLALVSAISMTSEAMTSHCQPAYSFVQSRVHMIS